MGTGQQNFLKKIKVILSFSHIRMSVIILFVAIIVLLISCHLDAVVNDFWSSILANIFAGLITGLVICLIGGIKQKNSFGLQAKIKWLEELAKMLAIYNSDYDKLRRIPFDKFDGNNDTYIFFCEIDIHANDINSAIIQNNFKERIGFDSLNFCKEKLDYNAESMVEQFRDLHFNINQIEINCPSKEEIIKYFQPVHIALMKLNATTHRTIRELKIEYSILQKTII